MRRNVRLQRRAHDLEIVRRTFCQADEDEPGEAAHVHGLQAELGAVEVLAHVLVVNQLAAQVVGPTVIRADEVAHDAAAGVAQAGAAMPANVVECIDLHVIVANDDDGVGADLDREEVTWLRNLRLDADKNPIAAENPGDVLLDRRPGSDRKARAACTRPYAKQ